MQSRTSHTAHTGSGHYHHLALMVSLSFLAMYALMYAMVDRFANVFSNLNQVYMAGLMAAAMVPIELLVMRSMYPDRKANVVTLAVSAPGPAAQALFLVAPDDREPDVRAQLQRPAFRISDLRLRYVPYGNRPESGRDGEVRHRPAQHRVDRAHAGAEANLTAVNSAVSAVAR